MELAGLEPATSWVRFGRPKRSNARDLQGFSRGRACLGPLPIPNVCRRVTGVKATERPLWPKPERATRA
jgi:hypothetical protein